MSRDLFDAVWQQSPHKGSDLLVLVAIADGTKDEGGTLSWEKCWWTVSTVHLARRCRLSVRSTQLSLSRLIASRAIAVSSGTGQGGRNRYQIIPPSEDHRPEIPRPLTDAQRQARMLGAEARRMQPVAPPVQQVAPHFLPSAQPFAPGASNALHLGDATPCTGPVQPVAPSGAKGCTQDREGTVSRTVHDEPYGGYPPPGDKKAPPRPPRGGKGTQAKQRTLHEIMAALPERHLPADEDPAILNQKPIDWTAFHESAQATKLTTDHRHVPKPRTRPDGD